MILYQVNVSVEARLADSYREWLQVHIPQVIKAGGFERAEAWLVSEPEAGRAEWIMNYFIQSRKKLDEYLRDQAPALRADAEKHFGGQFKAWRRIAELVNL